MVSVVPAAARAAKLAARYGPHVAAAWQIGGTQALAAAKEQQARIKHKRHAVDKARTVKGGSILRQRHEDKIVWVVFAEDEVVAVYPPISTSLEDLVRHADLAERVTPEEYDAARIRARARRAATGARTRVRPTRRSIGTTKELKGAAPSAD